MQYKIVSYTGNKYGNREYHAFLLQFLDKFNSHCRFYQIPYSLAYGSALGCVRNHGFIPWDDDVDVVMKRVDYNRFIETIRNGETIFGKEVRIEIPSVLLKVIDSTCNNYPVHIDIYPLDNVPDSRIRRIVKLVLVQVLKEIIIGRKGVARRGKKKALSTKIRNTIARVISFPFSVDQIRNLYTSICIRDNTSNNRECGCYCAGQYSIGKYHPSTILDRTIYMQFEDIELSIMRDYKLYLTKEFGPDYMTPKTKKGETING